VALDPSAPARGLIAASSHSLPRRRGRSGQRWSLDDIPWQAIRHDAIANSDAFFFLVATASLMESATELYTENLIDFFAGDDEVTDWLDQYWLPEELQHGQALRRYVETAWPQFDWEPTFRGFVEEFGPYCDVALERARSLEMASRCVVETGTASYYTTLSRASPEPVLRLLARRIVEDEVRHYKHFYRFLRKYRNAERPSRLAVVPALWRRLRMSGGDDGFIVVKHVHSARYPSVPFDAKAYRKLRRECRALARDHFPYEMSVGMLLKPLALGPRTQRVVLPVALALARRLVP
jgi:ferritin-like protein